MADNPMKFEADGIAIDRVVEGDRVLLRFLDKAAGRSAPERTRS
jgi:hypothetical protein